MKKKKADSFTCFLAALCTLIFFLLIRLFLGIQAVYPVVEIPVTLKIEDYTETTAFYGIDLSAFVQNPDEASLGTVPLLLLGKNSLSNMKGSNGHQISQKQQQKYLQMGEELSITYSLDTGIASDSLTATASYTTVSSATGSAASPACLLPYRFVSIPNL